MGRQLFYCRVMPLIVNWISLNELEQDNNMFIKNIGVVSW